MSEKSLVQLIEERLNEGGTDLPIFHGVVLELQRLFSRNDYNVKDIVELILQDQVLASRVLKVANSSFYAGLKAAKTIQEAVVRLGAQCVSNLAVMVTQGQVYASPRKEINALLERLWSHAVGTAFAARWLASRLGLNRLCDESFLAGLLHDIGKLFLLKVIEDLQKGGADSGSFSPTLIDDVLETMHCQHGERLMRQFNVPEIYCTVAARHHNDSVAGEDITLNLVKLANLTCRKLGIGLHNDPGLMLSTSPEALTLMAGDLMLAELQVEIEEHLPQMGSPPGAQPIPA
jgi:putative nucleotidyltransferase with HDIG domain